MASRSSSVSGRSVGSSAHAARSRSDGEAIGTRTWGSDSGDRCVFGGAVGRSSAVGSADSGVGASRPFARGLFESFFVEARSVEALFVGAFFVEASFAASFFAATFFVEATSVEAFFVGAFFVEDFFVVALVAATVFVEAFFAAAFVSGFAFFESGFAFFESGFAFFESGFAFFESGFAFFELALAEGPFVSDAFVAGRFALAPDFADAFGPTVELLLRPFAAIAER